MTGSTDVWVVFVSSTGLWDSVWLIDGRARKVVMSGGGLLLYTRAVFLHMAIVNARVPPGEQLQR